MSQLTGVAAVLLLGSISVASAQSELSGRVVTTSGEPVIAATVTLASIGYSIRTDSSGRFRLTGQPGATLALTLRADGFRNEAVSVTLGRGRDALEKDFVLQRTGAPEAEVNPSDRVVGGRVADPDGAPIAYANVQVNGGRIFATDDSGRFSVPIDVGGGFRLLFRRIGFEPAELKLDAMPDSTVYVQLAPVANALPEQRITGRSPFVRLELGGFYRRMADREKGIGRGYFITPEELEVRKPFLVTSSVEQLPNIRIRPSPLILGTYQRSTSPLNRNLRIEDGTGCPMTIYLDRVRISPVIDNGILKDEQINTLITPTTLSGIEVYTTKLAVPPEFSMVDGTCGTVVFWTR